MFVVRKSQLRSCVLCGVVVFLLFVFFGGSASPRKVFVDWGASKALSAHLFFLAYPQAQEYEYHAFEPNPKFERFFSYLKGVIFHQTAIWTSDGEKTFYPGSYTLANQQGELAGSINKNKNDLQYDAGITVTTVDGARWLKQNTKTSDYVILKMDLEGSEWDVLAHLIATGAIAHVDKIYGEFHPDYYCEPNCPEVENVNFDNKHYGHSYTKQDQDRIIAQLKEHDLTMLHWKAEDKPSIQDVDLNLDAIGGYLHIGCVAGHYS